LGKVPRSKGLISARNINNISPNGSDYEEHDNGGKFNIDDSNTNTEVQERKKIDWKKMNNSMVPKPKSSQNNETVFKSMDYLKEIRLKR
jgi:hypothetical protein